MARVTYEQGIKCKKCGELAISFNRFQKTILCQSCGAHVMTYIGNKEGELTKNAELVTIKVTHKLFSDIYEEVK